MTAPRQDEEAGWTAGIIGAIPRLWVGTPDARLESLYRVWRRLPAPVREVALVALSRIAAQRGRRLSGPERLVLFVTSRCTRRCDYCFYRDRVVGPAGQELTVDEIRRLARSLPARLSTVTLTGGEPFLRKDLPQVVRALVDENRCRAVTINTNGDLPERAAAAVAEIVRHPGVRLQLHVSIQEDEDLAGAPGRTLDAFLGLARRSSQIIRVAAQTTIVASNAMRIPNLVRAIRARGALAKLQHVRGVPGTLFPSSSACIAELPASLGGGLALSPTEQEAVNDGVLGLVAEAREPLMARSEWLHLAVATRMQRAGRPLYACGAGTAEAVVFETGDVSVCEPMVAAASLRDYDMDFAALWDDAPIRKARAAVRGCACTHPCNIATASATDVGLLRELLSLTGQP